MDKVCLPVSKILFLTIIKKTSPKGYSGLATSFLNKYREEKDEKIIAIHIAR